MLADLAIEWLSLDEAGIDQDVEETGSTFRENAVLKAQTYAKMTGLLTLADDSGLQVDALNGEPGIYTARYGGAGLTHEGRYQLLLQKMQDVPWSQRTAQFRAVIALAAPDGALLGTAEGVCEGMIAWEPAGDGGFGYDPVFYLLEREMTMAQVGSAVKHTISHRGQAMKAIEPLLRRVLQAL
jgi:XTP/dITP diphosphohydrolase